MQQIINAAFATFGSIQIKSYTCPGLNPGPFTHKADTLPLSSAARICSHKYTFKQRKCADWEITIAIKVPTCCSRHSVRVTQVFL